MSGGGGGGGSEESQEAKELYRAQAEIARAQWAEYQQYGSPVLKGLSEEALTPLSEGEYARVASRAGADVDQSYDAAEGELRTELGRYGVNPSSGRYVGTLRNLNLGRAASKAGAMTLSQDRARDRKDRLRFGTLAAAQGQAGSATQGLASAAGGFSDLGREASRRKGEARSGFGQLLGTAATAAAIYFSDRELKFDTNQVGELPHGIPLYSFRFYNSPETVRLGAMADEVEIIMPHAVDTHESGYKIVDYTKILPPGVSLESFGGELNAA